MTTLSFYEGSYQYNQIKTELNVTAGYIQMKLAMQYEYRPTTETLWAEVIENDIATRYQLDYENVRLELTMVFNTKSHIKCIL